MTVPDGPGMSSAADTTYTYTRALGPDVLYEVARDYDITGFCRGIVDGAQWSVTVRRKGGAVIGQSAGTFYDAMKQARELAEADAVTQAPRELPMIQGPLVKVE